MEPKEQILSELKEIAPFLGRAGFFPPPYAVPPGYFEGFIENLRNRIRLEMAGFSETAVLEIAEISPLLAGLQKKNPYQVPAGFFDSLNTKIPAEQSQKAKLISIPSSASDTKTSLARRISIPMRMVQLAAAACIVALIGIALFNTGNHQNTIDPIEGLTNVSDQDMANFMDADDIHWTPGITSTETASLDFSDNDIHELLGSVPDAELVQYAEALPAEKRSVN
jgi:hypothetical protein